MKASIDRIEGNVAVLIGRDDESQRIMLPVSLLPEKSREGDIISLSLEADPAETEAIRGRVAGFVRRLKK